MEESGKKPNTGFLKDMTNSSRYAYHYAPKYIKNNKEVIQSGKTCSVPHIKLS